MGNIGTLPTLNDQLTNLTHHLIDSLSEAELDRMEELGAGVTVSIDEAVAQVIVERTLGTDFDMEYDMGEFNG